MRGATYERQDVAWNMELVGHCDLGGVGDCMHVNIKDGYAFVAHMGQAGVSIVDVRDPGDPRKVGAIDVPPNTRGHKVQIVDDLLLVNRERLSDAEGGSWTQPWAGGLSLLDVSDPRSPDELGFWSCGGRGLHRMTYWEPPYAYVSAGSTDFGFSGQILMVIDLTDPRHPVEVGRWWFPGMRNGEEHLRSWPADRMAKLHHGLPRGDRLYCGWWDLGLVILDISDPTDPQLVTHLNLNEVDGPSRRTHTVCPLPGRDVLVVTDEEPARDKEGNLYHVRLVDISDETDPRVVSRLPRPEGDFATRGGRFGPHNVHESRPGSYRSGDRVFLTYFNAGVRVYDVEDVAAPREIGHYVPKSPAGYPAIQINDILVDADDLIYVTDRNAGGLYILAMTE